MHKKTTFLLSETDLKTLQTELARSREARLKLGLIRNMSNAPLLIRE